MTPAPTKPSNVAKRIELGLGDVAAGFAQADVVVERTFDTKPVHQGYIEPHACIATVSEDGQGELWVSTQGHWIVRAHCARLLGWDVSRFASRQRRSAAGSAARRSSTSSPLRWPCSRSGRPVKMAMTREEVLKASGPTSGAHLRVKMGAKKTAPWSRPRRSVLPGGRLGLARAAGRHVRLRSLRPRAREARGLRRGVEPAQGGGLSRAWRADHEFAVESVVDDLASKLGLDPIAFRLKNAAKQGTRAYGPKFGPVGFVETLEAAQGACALAHALG